MPQSTPCAFSSIVAQNVRYLKMYDIARVSPFFLDDGASFFGGVIDVPYRA